MKTQSMIILETDRLTLRHFEDDDIEDVYRLLYADEEVRKGWSGAEGTPEELKQRFVDKHFYPTDDFGFRALCLKQGELIGLMGFQFHERAEGSEIWYLLTASEPDRKIGQDENHIEAELTYALGQLYWKKGYAIEMGNAMVGYGFEKIGIRQIIQGVLGWNSNSINLMKRMGFRVEDRLRPGGVVGILDYDDWRLSQNPDSQ